MHVREEDIPKIAFCVNMDYLNVSTHFKMSDAPSTFLTYMNEVFTKHREIRPVYLDIKSIEPKRNNIMRTSEWFYTSKRMSIQYYSPTQVFPLCFFQQKFQKSML